MDSYQLMHKVKRMLSKMTNDTGAKANLISIPDIKKMTDKPKIRKKVNTAQGPQWTKH